LPSHSYDGKWGFIDKTGQWAIKPQFESAMNFSEGLALVQKDGKSGYIDIKGNPVIPFEYSGIGDLFGWHSAFIERSFRNGYALAEKDGKYIVLKNPLNSEAGVIGEAMIQAQSTITLPDENLQIIDSLSFSDQTINAYDLYPGEWGSDNESLENYTGQYLGVYFTNARIDDYGLSCASLVKRFYNKVYGIEIKGLGDGDIPYVSSGGNAKLELTTSPQVGDIAKSYGHSAIIKAIDGNNAVLFEQNWGYTNETIINRRIGISGTEYKFYHYVSSASALSASPSTTVFVMNDKSIVVPQAYLVSGNNYLQLRAIAVLLNGTESQFNVNWDGAYAVIETGKPYTGEVTATTLQDTSNVRPSSTVFKIDGNLVTFSYAYFIDGNTNYLQLREVAEKLSGTKSQFNVYWDSDLSQAVIEPGKAYTGKK
jgi:hypothetical protein